MSSCTLSPSSLAAETEACRELADSWCLDGRGGGKLGKGEVADVLGGRGGAVDGYWSKTRRKLWFWRW